jgi:hypothetical protein
MVNLAPTNVAGREGQVPTEKEGDGHVALADYLNGDRLPPADVPRRDTDLHVSRIEAGCDKFRANAVAHDGVIFTAFPCNPRSDRSRGLLPNPNVNQASEFDDAEENWQQNEGNRQHRLKRFLPPLPLQAAPRHEVWVSR